MVDIVNPERIRRQINELISYLMKVGLADDQNSAFWRSAKAKVVQITFKGSEHVSIALRDREYNEIYRVLAQQRAYNVKMLDGALIQMMYEFIDSHLHRHRLAFFPAPNLEEFQNDPEVYLADEIYADVTSKNIVPFPIRFDYDARGESHRELTHPKSHLSLGQYSNCRIPVTSPLVPSWFIDFVLRNFYDSETTRYVEKLPASNYSFDRSISSAECSIIHVAVPA